MGQEWVGLARTGNNTAMISDNTSAKPLWILNITRVAPILTPMKTALAITAFALTLTQAVPAQAACFADYKARRDNPLELHYGVAQIDGACTKANAQGQLRGRLARDGWRLLNVLQVFDESGLDSRRGSAGPFFLRY